MLLWDSRYIYSLKEKEKKKRITIIVRMSLQNVSYTRMSCGSQRSRIVFYHKARQRFTSSQSSWVKEQPGC